MGTIPKLLLEQGVLGLIVVCLGAVVMYLERDRAKLRKSCREQKEALAKLHRDALTALQSRLDTEHHERLNDARKYAKAVTEMSKRFRDALRFLASEMRR